MMKEETLQQIQSAIKALEKAIDWIEPLRQANTGVGRIKHSMHHAKSILEDLAEWMAGEADRLREERGELRELVLFAIDRIDAVEAKEAIKAMLSVILQPKLSDHA